MDRKLILSYTPFLGTSTNLIIAEYSSETRSCKQYPSRDFIRTNSLRNNAKLLLGFIYLIKPFHFVTFSTVLETSPNISEASLNEIYSELDPIAN